MRLLKVISTHKKNLVLAIESSCDDTCLAILRTKNKIIHEYKFSQKKLHQPFGGVVPQLAALGHRNSFHKILAEDRLRKLIEERRIKYIAVASGPGIGSCLNVGYEFACNISRSSNVPLIPINHLLGHLLSVDYKHEIGFPRLSLIVSGGNTQLVFSSSFISHHILGLTIDDAVGEALDKTARLLNCSWSESGGLGRELEKFALSGKPVDLNIKSLGNCRDPLSFSFSGLKTALKKFILETNSSTSQNDLAATIQETLFGHLVDRVKNCFEILEKCGQSVKTLSLIGGVASNKYLRNSLVKLCKEFDVALVSPEPKLCTDNAVMIGLAAEKIYSASLYGELPLDFPNRIYPDWNLEELNINKAILE